MYRLRRRKGAYRRGRGLPLSSRRYGRERPLRRHLAACKIVPRKRVTERVSRHVVFPRNQRLSDLKSTCVPVSVRETQFTRGSASGSCHDCQLRELAKKVGENAGGIVKEGEETLKGAGKQIGRGLGDLFGDDKKKEDE